jgi:DNA-binding MarR family transcriptional regulator
MEGDSSHSAIADGVGLGLPPAVVRPDGFEDYSSLHALIVERVHSILEILKGPIAPPAAHPTYGRAQLRAVARRILEERDCRTRHLPAEIFGEPAWDILLTLFISDRALMGKEVHQAGRVPVTTAIRWVAYLEQEKLIEKTMHTTDSRRIQVRLTPRGEDAVVATLRNIIDSGKGHGLSLAARANFKR